MNDRLTSPVFVPDDAKSDALLRPRKLEDFVGQTELKENLRVFIDAARQRPTNRGSRFSTNAAAAS